MQLNDPVIISSAAALVAAGGYVYTQAGRKRREAAEIVQRQREQRAGHVHTTWTCTACGIEHRVIDHPLKAGKWRKSICSCGQLNLTMLRFGYAENGCAETLVEQTTANCVVGKDTWPEDCELVDRWLKEYGRG